MKIKLFAVFLVIYSLVMTTACPSRVTLEKAKTESSRVAVYANATVDVVRELYRSKTISLEQKDRIADKLIVLARGGAAFDALVNQMQSSYGNTGNVPKAEFALLLDTFNVEVVNKFLDALAAMKIIKVSDHLRNAINLLLTSIKIIAQAFGKQKSVGARIDALAEGL